MLKAAVTADGWTSFSQDHYLTVMLHYVRNGQAQEKVLKTKPVYQAQTGTVVAVEIDEILEEYGIKVKVVAATVDNVANMDVAEKARKFSHPEPWSSEALQLSCHLQPGGKNLLCDCMDKEVPHSKSGPEGEARIAQ